MNRNARRAIDAWSREVDDTAAWLIDNGHTPLEAFELAKKIISERRRRNPSIQPPASTETTGQELPK